MNNPYLNKITLGDCIQHLSKLEKGSVDLFLSDIPYGISLDEWDVLHNNTNSALLGQSPAQVGKSGFKKRGKPINGWCEGDKNIGKQYEDWVYSWSQQLLPVMKKGSSLYVFGARRTLHRVINAFENSGFLLRDVLAWKKNSAHHRAQRLSGIFEKRGLKKEAIDWDGWRLGNLAPIYEPIAWFFKPYDYTITDNILEHGVGALNMDGVKLNGISPTNLLEYGFRADEERIHEAQKPESLIEFLIKLSSREGNVILDPFMGSGTTAVSASKMGRDYIGFELIEDYWKKSQERLKNAEKQAVLFR